MADVFGRVVDVLGPVEADGTQLVKVELLVPWVGDGKFYRVERNPDEQTADTPHVVNGEP